MEGGINPVESIHLTPQKSYEKRRRQPYRCVYPFGDGDCLLLTGWVNALNLMVVRFLERGKEFGVRKAFGASRRQMLLQGLTEAGIVNLHATLIALGWLEVLLPLVYTWAEHDFGADILVQPQFWLAVAVIAGLGTLFTGLYPSYLLTRIRPSDIIRGKLLHSRKGNKMRKTLIVVQFVASFILITGTFVVISQVRYMQNEAASSGTDPDSRIEISLLYR